MKCMIVGITSQFFLIHYFKLLIDSNTMYMIVRINNQAAHLMTSQTTGSPPSFLGTMFGSWLITTKRHFDKYVVSATS